MEPPMGHEPMTFPLPWGCSTNWAMAAKNAEKLRLSSSFEIFLGHLHMSKLPSKNLSFLDMLVFEHFYIFSLLFSSMSQVSIEFSLKIQAGVRMIFPSERSIYHFSRSFSRSDFGYQRFERRNVRRSWIIFSSLISTSQRISSLAYSHR